MKGSGILPLLGAALLPLLLFGLIIGGLGFGVVAWKPPTVWSDTFGVQLAANDVTAVAVDSSGRYLTGFLNTSYVNLLGTPFMRKYDLAGREAWTRTLPSTPSSTYYPVLTGISVDSDGIFSVGIINGNITLLKSDDNGNQVWSRQSGDGVAEGVSATSGRVIIAGDSYSLSPSQRVAFVRDYDSNGNVIWTRQISNSTVVNALYVNSQGVFVLTDKSLSKFDNNGGQIWVIPVDGWGLSGDSTGVYVSSTSLQKYGYDGTEKWRVSLESLGTFPVTGTQISADSSGVYVSIASGNNANDFVTKYDPNGNQIWNTQVEGSSSRALSSLGLGVTVAADGVYLVGTIFTGENTWYALIEELSRSSSLVFFGLNPPWSFVALGGLIGGGTISLIVYRRLQKKRRRPSRVGTPGHILPTKD